MNTYPRGSGTPGNLENTPESLAAAFHELRVRASLSLSDLARALGFKGASSLQRYEKPRAHSGGYLEISLVRKMEAVLVGRGHPPITAAEVYALAGPEFAAAHSLLDGNIHGDQASVVQEVKVGSTGTLVPVGHWRLPARLSQLMAIGPASPVVVAIHHDEMSQTVFIDRKKASITSAGTYAIADAAAYSGFKVEVYDDERFSAEAAALRTGVLGLVVARFSVE